ncbi:MAG: MerR family transcriptional regulator [Firmicutes bacterium]|nr:MerR family transcriptional regulator [Bacillota bacterium]
MGGVEAGLAVYPIGVVGELTGLTARKIRYYEQEALLKPSRSRGNRRLYSSQDVERLKLIKSLIGQGLGVEGAREYLHRMDEKGAPREAVVEESSDQARRANGAPGGAGVGAGRRRLSSLFPVDNQAELVQRLESARASREDCDPGSPAILDR